MPKPQPPKTLTRSLVEWLFAVAAAVFLFLLLHFFVLRIANVDGSSMEPTLHHRDTVALSRLAYIFGDPQPGDIVAFPYPGNRTEHYIKRVIGLPGDVIDLVGQRFTVNGIPIDDAFSADPIVAPGDTAFPLTVPEGCCFVLGDNRNGSKDSRYTSVGCVPEGDIIGKVVLRLWPPDAFGLPS